MLLITEASLQPAASVFQLYNSFKGWDLSPSLMQSPGSLLTDIPALCFLKIVPVCSLTFSINETLSAFLTPLIVFSLVCVFYRAASYLLNSEHKPKEILFVASIFHSFTLLVCLSEAGHFRQYVAAALRTAFLSFSWIPAFVCS